MNILVLDHIIGMHTLYDLFCITAATSPACPCGSHYYAIRFIARNKTRFQNTFMHMHLKSRTAKAPIENNIDSKVSSVFQQTTLPWRGSQTLFIKAKEHFRSADVSRTEKIRSCGWLLEGDVMRSGHFDAVEFIWLRICQVAGLAN